MEKQTDDPNRPMYPDKFSDPVVTDVDPDSISADFSNFRRDDRFKWMIAGLLIAAVIFIFLIIVLVVAAFDSEPATQIGELREDQEELVVTTANP